MTFNNLKQRHIYMLTRKEKRITLTEIAKSIGISTSSISQYESGKISLKKENLQAYQKYIETHDNRK